MVCSGVDNSCVPVDEGTDPLNDCEEKEQSTCGYTGLCTGYGTCAYWPDDTVCQPQICTNNIQYETRYCNGSGNCVALPAGTTPCCPYSCGSDGECNESCVDDNDCICPPYFCQDGQCVEEEKGANGETCDEHAQCKSGFCVDGVCCNAMCNQFCVVCNLPDKEGFCTYQSAQTDDEDDCAPCTVCSGIDDTCVPADEGTDPAGDCDAGWHCAGGACVPE